MAATLRCLDVLNLLSESPQDLGVSEVAGSLGLPPPTAHRLLGTLVKAGLVERDRVSRRYGLSPKVLRIGAGYLRNSPVYRASFILLQELAGQVEGTVELAVMHEDKLLHLFLLGHPATRHKYGYPGDYRPLHATALGKTLLAYRPAEDVERIMSRPCTAFTAKTITTLDAMRKELETVRRQGYATNEEEFEYGFYAVAAPVRDRSGAVVAAICIGQSRPGVTGVESGYPAKLCDTALKISLQLGYEPSSR